MSDTEVLDTSVRPMYEEMMSKIEEIDIVLDSLDDTTGAGKRKIASDLVEKTESIWSTPAQNIISQLQNLDDETLVGVFRGIRSELDKAFDEKTKQTIDTLVEEAPKVEPLCTPEEATVFSDQRSALYQNIKMAVKLAETMDGVTLAMPKSRRGSRGKRGPRAMSLMVWSINGEELDAEKFKDVAIAAGFEAGKELTAYLKSKDVDTTNPEGGQISVELPDGRTLDGYIPDQDDDDDSDD